MEKQTVTIPLEEYKELLETKGRWLESKNKRIEFVSVPEYQPTPNTIPSLNPYEHTTIMY